jgi:hypothetical protein
MTIYGIIALIIGSLGGAYLARLQYKLNGFGKIKKTLDDKIIELKSEVQRLDRRVITLRNNYNKVSTDIKNRKSGLRKGIWISKGWHFTKDAEENPTDYKKWNMVFTVRELGESTQDKAKFEILACRGDDGEKHNDIDHYRQWFKENRGGWIPKKDIEYIEMKSKKENRGDRLSDVLN